MDKLLKIAGVWVPDPDPDSWSPVHNPEWSEGTGRTANGTAVGTVKFKKWKLPLSWTNLSEEDECFIEELIDNAGDFFEIEFYHRRRYIKIIVYAGTFTPTGIKNVGGKLIYSKCTVNLIEQ